MSASRSRVLPHPATLSFPTPAGRAQQRHQFTVQIVFTPNATGAIAATLDISSSTSGVTPRVRAAQRLGAAQTGWPRIPRSSISQCWPQGRSSTGADGHRHQLVQLRHRLGRARHGRALQHRAKHLRWQPGRRRQLQRVSVVFQPSASGSSAGVLTVTSAAVATPATVALSGTGFDLRSRLPAPPARPSPPASKPITRSCLHPMAPAEHSPLPAAHCPPMLCACSARAARRSARAFRAMSSLKSPQAAARLCVWNSETPDFRLVRVRGAPHRSPAAYFCCLWRFCGVASFFFSSCWPYCLWAESPAAPAQAAEPVARAAMAMATHAAGHLHDSRHRQFNRRLAFRESDTDRGLRIAPQLSTKGAQSPTSYT